MTDVREQLDPTPLEPAPVELPDHLLRELEHVNAKDILGAYMRGDPSPADEMEARMRALEGRVSTLEGRLSRVTTDLYDLLDWLKNGP